MTRLEAAMAYGSDFLVWALAWRGPDPEFTYPQCLEIGMRRVRDSHNTLSALLVAWEGTEA